MAWVRRMANKGSIPGKTGSIPGKTESKHLWAIVNINSTQATWAY